MEAAVQLMELLALAEQVALAQPVATSLVAVMVAMHPVLLQAAAVAAADVTALVDAIRLQLLEV